jgi:cardiolipin synthase
LTNFDSRSFPLNDEATLNVLDAEFARQQTVVFESDLSRSRPISFAQWRARPWRERFGVRLASLFDA